MRRRIVAVAVASGVLLPCAPLVAHHSFSAEFDATKPVTSRGTVTKMAWVNPHTWIYIDVRTSEGAIAKWEIEGGAPNALFRRGFTKDSLPAGSEIIVGGYQAKDGANRANGRDIVFADGRRLFMGSSGNGAPGDPDPQGK